MYIHGEKRKLIVWYNSDLEQCEMKGLTINEGLIGIHGFQGSGKPEK